MSCDLNKTRTSARGRFLDFKLNVAGAYKAAKNYLAFKDLPDYETKYKKKYIYAERQVGAIDGAILNQFTPTTSPNWTVDELANKYAIFFVDADADALEGDEDNQYKLATLPYTIQKIVSNTADNFTVGSDILTGTTGVVIVDDPWLRLEQILDYTFDDTANRIDANDADSGDYATGINGIKSADITGVTGHYYIGLPTQFQLQQTKLAGCTLDVRHGASEKLDETVYFQTVSVNSFFPSGTLEGNTMMTYSGTLTNEDTVQHKTIVVEGTVPDFL